MRVDDRLASILDELSADERWQAFERDLGQHLIRVYDLHPSRVRVDSTTVSGYVHPSPDGLFQFGHSKDHRPDLPQVKIKLSALDPLGLPMGVTVVGGQRADDGLYVPAIEQAQQTLRQRGLLYVGDCKMAALSTRAYVHQSGDYYLGPSPKEVSLLATDDKEGGRIRRCLNWREVFLTISDAPTWHETGSRDTQSTGSLVGRQKWDEHIIVPV
jgi:transposase